MSEAVSRISQRLAQLGHEVTVAARGGPHLAPEEVIDGVTVTRFQITGNLANGIVGEVDRYRGFLLAGRFDVMANFAAQQWATDIALPILGRIHGKKVFVPTGFSGLYMQEYAAYFAEMKTWMSQYDANVYLSEDYRDIRFARENGISAGVVIPNGAGREEFDSPADGRIRRRFGLRTDDLLILNVSSHTGLKGHADLFEVFRKANLSNAVLLQVGDAPTPGCGRQCRKRSILDNLRPASIWRRKRAVPATLSREDTVAAYKEADLFLFPSNVECSPIVLFESMASGTPFLSSDCGNAAEICRWSESGRVLPTTFDERRYSLVDTEGSARMLEDLARDEGARKRMAASGREQWMNRFTWEHIGVQYESLYSELLSGSAPRIS